MGCLSDFLKINKIKFEKFYNSNCYLHFLAKHSHTKLLSFRLLQSQLQKYKLQLVISLASNQSFAKSNSFSGVAPL